ncbi:MAG: arginase [Anaerolineaceae bacterium]|nr:MAG: arginase [Anaerolineaceae bacterium]
MPHFDLFDWTQRPSPDLLYRRDDGYDIRWGEAVRTDAADYSRADVVLLGLPQDEGVRRNRGRVGARHAPSAIREYFYRTVARTDITLFDAGDTRISDGLTLEAIHERHQAIVAQIIADGKTLIVLGGGNDTSYPDCAALAQATDSQPLAFNIDAHFDVRADTPRNSGTPYRQLLEGGFIRADGFFEIGYQPFANPPAYHDYLREKGVQTFPLAAVRGEALPALLRRLLAESDANAVFWGVDMDVVRASDAPGVSAVNPTGLSGEALCTVATIAGAEERTRLFEITEVNPHYDVDGRTSRLASAAIWHFLAER